MNSHGCLARRCADLESDVAELGEGLRQAVMRAAEAEQECDSLRAEVARLRQEAARQAALGGWQAGYDKGRRDGSKFRLSELEQERRINAELRLRAAACTFPPLKRGSSSSP